MLDSTNYSKYPWRIKEIAPDFELRDAWTLHATGGLDDFADLCDIVANLDTSPEERATLSQVLFAIRFRLGELLHWDEGTNTLPIPGCNESSLRDRLPADLPAETTDTAGRLPFRAVYRTEDEWALELSNSILHAILHVGWAPQPEGTYRGQLGVYVKHRGRGGKLYMAAIAPFRHRVVYPGLLRHIEREWRQRTAQRGVVAVIHEDGKFLWIKRGPDVVKPGYWAPPSGSIEPDESAEEAIVREMTEELGIEVRPIREVWQCPTEDGAYTLEWWLTEIESGRPRQASAEVSDVRWVTPSEIRQLSPIFPDHLTFIDDIWPKIGDS